MKRDMKTIEELKAEVASTQLPQQTKELFYKVLDTADIASLSGNELHRYESDLKNYMDTMGCIRYAENRGEARGIEIGQARGIEIGEARGQARGEEKAKAEIASTMKKAGMSAEMIAHLTGLAPETIENL